MACGSNTKQVKYDATLETKVFGFDTKFTFKTPNYSALIDLGAYRWTKVISGKQRDNWLNPYIKINLDQTLRASDLALGVISTLDSKCLSSHLINISKDKETTKLIGQTYL